MREARLGVFYGGQVQERLEVPRVLEGRQTQGFRLVFREPLERAATVRWEIEMPGSKGPSTAPLAVTRLGKLLVPVGQQQIDQSFDFEPGDPLGLWNIRVFVDQSLVIDRAWSVFDPAQRRQKAQDKDD